MRKLLLILCPAAMALAQAPPHENLNAVVWMQTSAEYRAAARQTYRAALASLIRALQTKAWTAATEQTGRIEELPPAVILDLDETVLDNSAFQARLTAAGESFDDEVWQNWVAEEKAGLVPGAREFLLEAHARGAAIFYITNRVCNPGDAADPTVAVLRAHLLPFHPDRLLCKTTTSDKSQRRAAVAARNRVLLLIGDDFNDFVSLAGARATVEGRQTAVEAFAGYWGERWFMLPNPTYGSWERSVGHKVDQKRKMLRQ